MTKDFDIHAKNYDTDFTYSEIGKAQRNRVYYYLNKHILSEKKLNILELNCGTGEDAYYLSKQGHRVLATEISSEMIKVAKEKNKNTAIRFQQVDITKITLDKFSEKFDLIFSNFGGLNCISKSQLAQFITVSSSLLQPTGIMALVIMPKKCLWEQFYFSLKGEFKKAFRRNTKELVLVNVEGVQVSTWYYNPREVISLTKNEYSTTLVKPIGIAIPPSYLESFFKNYKWFLNLLVLKEKVFSNRFWAKYSDHYLISLKKKG